MRAVNCILLKESSFAMNNHPHFTYLPIYILSIINSIDLAGWKNLYVSISGSLWAIILYPHLPTAVHLISMSLVTGEKEFNFTSSDLNCPQTHATKYLVTKYSGSLH